MSVGIAKTAKITKVTDTPISMGQNAKMTQMVIKQVNIGRRQSTRSKGQRDGGSDRHQWEEPRVRRQF